jgi:general secretion pathway protein F
MMRVTSEVLTEVQRGKSLAEALGDHPDVFESLYVNMVKAGEIGGVLDQVLERLTEYLESATELRDEVRSAMVYPTILILTSFGSVAVLLVYVLPQFSTVFAQSGAALPTSAAILMGASDLLRSFWWVGLLLIALTGFGFTQWIATEDGRVTWDRTKLRLILVGELTRKVAVSRFARTLGTLLRSGVPMLQALDIVRNVAGNVVLAAAIDEVKEETGRLDEMLITVADYFDKEVRAAVTQMTNMLEPLLLVVGGLIVGFIVVAMFSAIFSVNNMPL